jgi:DNA-binding GntR family transcriptional regulator
MVYFPYSGKGRRGDLMGSAAKVSKSELVYDYIKARIMSGDYSPGYRLVLDSIARDLKVSPVPVREAVRRLEAEGHVEFQRNVGARVVGIDPVAYSQTMQTLACLEGFTTALASPHLTANQIDAATAINRQMAELRRAFDPIGFTALNQQFHEILVGACPNQHALSLLHREWERMAMLRRSTFTFVPGRAATSVEEHDTILHLIRSKASAAEVEEATRNHKLRTLDQFLHHNDLPAQHSA